MKKLSRKEWIKQLKPYWKAFREIENAFHTNITRLENTMKIEIMEPDIEFAWVEGGIVGIGSPTKIFKLIHESELEE